MYNFLGNLACCIVFYLVTYQGHAADGYQPPLGIPAPEFGISESVQAFRGKKFGQPAHGGPASAEFYRESAGGIYTHYVDSAASNATDANNPLGSSARPRVTIPVDLPAGSIVELHGGPYALRVMARGTREKPVFIRGTGTNAMATVNEVQGLKGSTYLICEYLNVRCPRFPIHQNSHHICIRYCDFSGTPMPPAGKRGAAITYTWADTAWKEGEKIDHIVWFRNRIHDNGEFPATFESGIHGIGIANGTERVWVLENEIFRNAEDGIHVFGGGRGAHPRHIYIGRNIFREDGENAIDVKKASDVVISENEMTGYKKTHFPKSGSEGAAIVLNDDSPSDQLWILNNRIHHCTAGIRSQSSGSVYILGNAISSIRHEEGQRVARSSGSNPGVAIWSNGSTNLHIVNNSIREADGGIYVHNGVLIQIYNNVVSDINETITYHIAVNRGQWEIKASNNLLFNRNGAVRVRGVAAGGGSGAKAAGFLSPVAESFELAPDSPLKDAGLVPEAYETFRARYGLAINRDLFGAGRPAGGGWDVGAVEIGGASEGRRQR